MKKLILICINILFLLSFSFAKDIDVYKNADKATLAVLSECDNLVQQRKYKSAWDVLDKAEQNEYIIYKKIYHCTHYFAQSIMHTDFAFVDLQPGQTLMEVRRNGKDFSLISYQGDTVIKEYTSSKGNAPILDLALALYYSDVYIRYSNQWIKSGDEIKKEATDSFEAAKKQGVYNHYTLKNMALMYSIDKKYDMALPYYQDAVKLESKDGNLWYNIGLCYYYTQQNDLAIQSLKSAIKYPENDIAGVYDAYSLLAHIYTIEGNEKLTEQTYLDMVKNFAQYPDPYIELGKFYYESHRQELAKNQFVKACKVEPYAASEIVQYYIEWNDDNSAINLCTQMIAESENIDKFILGNYRYILAQIYYIQGKYEMASKLADMIELDWSGDDKYLEELRVFKSYINQKNGY